MPKKDSRIDNYIAGAATFARPILRHFRRLVHEACPKVEETMKWRMPHFDYEGRVICGMAAFKQHCAINFWNSDLVFAAGEGTAGAMGDFGRVTKLSDLPPDEQMRRYIRKAVELRKAGVTAPRERKAVAREKLVVPQELTAALRLNKRAGANFERFSYSHKKEYAQWIAEAKRPETREKRLATALEWIAEAKSRDWKYKRR
jgi:uncharacterized protein YdeI (YjbR/CyaY-like superfamily)